MDPNHYYVAKRGEEIKLTAKEFEILKLAVKLALTGGVLGLMAGVLAIRIAEKSDIGGA